MARLINPWGGSMRNVGFSGSPYQNFGGQTPFSASRNPLMRDYQQAYGAAQRANEGRYRQISDLYNQRITEANQLLEGQGKSAMTDLNQEYDELGAQRQQQLIGRGLANTTVTSTLAQRTARERTRAQTRLNESINAQKLNIGARLTGDLAGFMERRTDAYPDLNQYMRAAQMQGFGQSQMPPKPGPGYIWKPEYGGWYKPGF